MTEATKNPEATEAIDESAVPETDSTRRIHLHVTDDQAQVLLDAEDPLADLEEAAARIHAACEELKLPEFPDVVALRYYLEQTATPGADLVDEPLIMGRYPVAPVDGKILWARDFFEQGWAVNDETGTMDFWEPLERRSVSTDEEICRLIPPVAGKTGLTVFNQPIPVRKPRVEKVRSGKNIEVIEEADGTHIFTAACDGRVLHAVGVVSVDDVYTIKGDVSLETGNIYHTGSVQVTGDVKAGAVIEVGGDVVIQGLVEPSTIVCGGSLSVDGGIVGDGTGRVEAAANVQALYISEATVSCGGDLVVGNEIIHTDVDCLGRVLTPNGRIAGGHVVALGGIRVGTAGASGSTGTILVAGLDPTVAPRVEKLREQLPRLEAIHKKLRQVLHRFRVDKVEMDDEQRLAVTEIRAKIKQIEAAIVQVGQDIDDVHTDAAKGANEEILVHTELWSGTTIQLGDLVKSVLKSVHKPRKIRRSGQDVLILPLGEDAGQED